MSKYDLKSTPTKPPKDADKEEVKEKAKKQEAALHINTKESVETKETIIADDFSRKLDEALGFTNPNSV